MELLHNLAELASDAVLEFACSLILGALLAVLLLVPSLRSSLGSWLFRGRSEVESTGRVIEAVAGLVILIFVVALVLFGH